MGVVYLLCKALAGGVAATGFAILFNVRRPSLLYIFVLGFIAIFTKILLMNNGINIIFSSFVAAVFVGLLCQLVSVMKQTPPLVVAIPSVIPMVPGIFLYRAMIALIKLADTKTKGDGFIDLLSGFSHNTLTAVFILCSISIGISFPYLIFRKTSFNYYNNKK
ncbi:MAG: threonine/serine exporter family protein [Marinifilaceae bacterium]|jgi:uncharacterized membrane protein YjjB (DUF3815 family)|nr:threonine/serine exporter family protein [Marinifilaceae bacterium]